MGEFIQNNTENPAGTDTASPALITKPIRLIELFGGIGTQAMALERLGVPFEHYRLVEFDADCVKSYNAIHGTDFTVQDINDIHIQDLGITEKEKYDYLLTYSFPCFTGNTLVLTERGYLPIKDVREGDRVLTHDNSWQKVLKSQCTGIKNIWKVETSSCMELHCTYNHKFYVRKKLAGSDPIRLSAPAWAECRKLTSSYYMSLPVNQESKLPDSEDPKLNRLFSSEHFWWLAGYFLYNGWVQYSTHKPCGVFFSHRKVQMETISSHLQECGLSSTTLGGRGSDTAWIHFSSLGEFFDRFGEKGDSLPCFLFSLPQDLLQSFLSGLAFASTGDENSVFADSLACAYGLVQIIAKAYHRCGKLHKADDGYRITWSDEDLSVYEDGFLWYPVRSVTNTDHKEEVYDITVEKNHDFLAGCCIAHNCTDLSVAGQMKGMSKGSNTRSSLLWQVERILQEAKELGEKEGISTLYLPDVLVMENVTQVHSKKNMADFQIWLDDLTSFGYLSKWEDMNAKDYGIPQNRNRTFMVSWLDHSKTYTFPEPIPLPCSMEAYLQPEDEVEEKYYIQNKRADDLIHQLIERYGNDLEKYLR